MSYRLRKQTADTQTILQPNTPAYHTSEQTTLQTPDSLCLDPHTTLANTYDDFRVTTYNLRLMTSQLCFTGTHWDPPPASSLSVQYLSQEPANTYYSIRISTKKADVPTPTPTSQPANTYYSIRISTKKADIPTPTS